MFKSISIKVNLLTYFIAIIGMISVVLIGLQYSFSLSLADKAADSTFEQVAEKLSIFIRERDDQLQGVIELASHSKGLEKIPLPGELHKNIDTMINVLNSNPGIYAVYIGKNNGDFYEVIHMKRFEGLHEKFGADKAAQYAVVHITNADTNPGTNTNINNGSQHNKHWFFYNEYLQLLSSKVQTTNYDPRIRPWFRKALKSEKVTRTEPYLFSFINSSGITYAKKLDSNNGVLGMDITMSALNEFLQAQSFGESSEIFLYDVYGEKYASSNPEVLQTNKASDFDVDFTPLQLSDEDKKFVENLGLLRVSNEVDWPPLDFAVRGVPMGYSVDYLNLLASKIGLKIQFINGYTWDELVELFKEGNLDLLQSAFFIEERKEFALFTDAFYEYKTQVILRKGVNIDSLTDLNGKTIALPKGWGTIDFIRENYPQINIIEAETTLDAYFAVHDGLADATVDHQLSLDYISDKYQLENLYLGPWLKDFDDNSSKKLHIMVQKEQGKLRDIINQAITSVTPEEIDQLKQRLEKNSCKPGMKCAESDVKSSSVADRVFMGFKSDEESGLIRYENEHSSYYAYSSPLDTFAEKGHRLGIVESTESFLGPFMEKVRVSLYSAIAVVLLSLPIILFAIRQILKPIQALMNENDKIAMRRYKDVKKVKTHIKEMVSLSESMIHMTESIQAFEKAQEELMDSFILLIADAIDTKSPYTGGHCTRVPEIAMMLAQKAHDLDTPPFDDFHMENDDQWREFRVGAWLHDCGKVITPEYVVDKATKLETINNRINEIRTRFEVLWRDAEITGLNRQLDGEQAESVKDWLEQEKQKLIDEFNFIAECNVGGEFLSEDKQQRLAEIAEKRWMRHFDNRLGLSEEELKLFGEQPKEDLPVEEKLLDDKSHHVIPRENFDEEAYKAQGFKLDVPEHLYNKGELYNLSISRGTLTEEERFKINEHIIMTIRMLEQLPLPDHLKRVPEYAGTHHETLIGTGYPRKLTRDELSIHARIMVLADIFEALTASDRPYKKAKKLSEAIKIMGFMCKDAHIDADVFKLFLKSGVYLDYAKKHMDAKQIDEVDIEQYMNCEIKQK